MSTPIESITEIDATSMNNMNNNTNNMNALNTYLHIPTQIQNQSPQSPPAAPVMSSVDRAIKKEVGASGGGGSIVNLAMQMQKERENEAPARPGMPPMN